MKLTDILGKPTTETAKEHIPCPTTKKTPRIIFGVGESQDKVNLVCEYCCTESDLLLAGKEIAKTLARAVQWAASGGSEQASNGTVEEMDAAFDKIHNQLDMAHGLAYIRRVAIDRGFTPGEKTDDLPPITWGGNVVTD